MLIFLASCEEVYTPSIETFEGQLVVESLITNDPKQNFIHLTRTTSFYATNAAHQVAGAKVSLIQINGNEIQGIEISPGNFNLNTTPVAGQNYKLQILLDNDTYESEIVTMPPVPSVSSFNTSHVVKKIYVTDAFGNPVAYNIVGRELLVDVPITNDLSYYRFTTRAIFEWFWLEPPVVPPFIAPPPPPRYGWETYFTGNKDFIIAGPEKFSQTGIIEEQPLLLLNYDPKLMMNSDGQPLLRPDSSALGWIIILNEYGTSKGSYDFHKKLNSQFAATGTLFDPVETQIYGNISCKTDPSKLAFGYFELNSFKQYRYYLRFNNTTDVLQRQIFRYPDIPDHGVKEDWPPDWWE